MVLANATLQGRIDDDEGIIRLFKRGPDVNGAPPAGQAKFLVNRSEHLAQAKSDALSHALVDCVLIFPSLVLKCRN